MTKFFLSFTLEFIFKHTILQTIEVGPLIQAEDLKLHSRKFLSCPGIFSG